MSANRARGVAHRFGAGAWLLIFIVSACSSGKDAPRGSAAAAARDASGPGDPWRVVAVMLDGARIHIAPPAKATVAARGLASVLPSSASDVGGWMQVRARASDGRVMTVNRPAQRYPGARFELRRAAGNTAPTLWFGTAKPGEAFTGIRSLPGVVEVHVATRARDKPTLDAGGATSPALSLEVGGRIVPLSWQDLSHHRMIRPKGVRKAGYPLREILRPHVKVAGVRRVTLHGSGKRYEVTGTALRGADTSALVWRNRRGLVRFRHYALRRSPGEKSSPRELGGLRGVERIVIEMR